MEVEKQTMTNDEVSMERSKSFVTALQELKNLRPQLYSAADYCEKSYLNSEQKHMFVDNLKDYAVRALVNAIDHLGTVAYKLSDVVEQQTLEITSMDVKVTCLNQKLLTCQTYTEKEGLRQQQLLAIIPRHHKHYTLPTRFLHQEGALRSTDRDGPNESHSNERCSCFCCENSFLAYGIGNKVDLERLLARLYKCRGLENGRKNIWRIQLIRYAKENKRLKSAPATRVAMQTLGVTRRDPLEDSKPVISYKSFDNPTEKEIVRPPVRSKSMISSFFARQKATSLRTDA
ncbi:hypothetical protein CASFOL_033594 [Castilleja foliolosa]|uniref:Protein ABIL1 n=1 Tax=Castilleja foliolosa TaxID=1961234 RepID=A0ABD3BXD7_9LAMI